MVLRNMNFSQPAILLGNGLNNHFFMNSSWIQLLSQLVDTAIPRSFFKKDDLNYPEFFDAVSFNNQKGYVDYKSLKEKVCNKIINWEGSSGHHKLTEFARINNIPIVTTNFDLTLIDEKIRLKMKIKDGSPYENMKPRITTSSRKGFSDFYPWHACYSDYDILSATTQFAIWHMHGIACYQRSLNVGAIDYGNNISRYKYYLDNKRKVNDSSWIGKKSWLEVFFYCDLLILGLSLDSQETSLRWLLMEREKFFRKNPLSRRRTVFVLNKAFDTLGEGKRYFFNSIGIEICEKPNGKEIYEDWEV